MAFYSNTGNTVRFDSGSTTFVLGTMCVGQTDDAAIVAMIAGHGGFSIASWTPGSPKPPTLASDPYPKFPAANAISS